MTKALLASKIKNLPIIATNLNQIIGRVKDLVFDPANGRLVALIIRQGILGRTKILSLVDLNQIYANGLTVANEEALVQAEEIIRVNQILESKVRVITALAWTENGKSLGLVTDVLINPQSSTISKFYLRGFFGLRIISAEKVVIINRKGVIFQDDLEKKMVSQEIVEPAV